MAKTQARYLADPTQLKSLDIKDGAGCKGKSAAMTLIKKARKAA
jgi:hypothetical protein